MHILRDHPALIFVMAVEVERMVQCKSGITSPS